MIEILVCLAAGILLPIVPAFIIYKTLPPGKTVVKGPLQGFQIQLTGAFGAYFIIVLVAFAFMYSTNEWEVWQIMGRIRLTREPPYYARRYDIRETTTCSNERRWKLHA